MSNFRMFCIALVVCHGVMAIVDLLGVEPVYPGEWRMVAKFIGSIFIASGWVALRGDRKT